MLGLERIYKHYNLQLFLCSGLLTLSSANYGFDNQGFAQTQAMNAFDRRFGECNKKGVCTIPSYFLSFLNGFPFIGFAFGILLGSTISSHVGRRWTVFLMSIWAMVSATVIITSHHREQMLVARCLNYIYIGMELSVIPVFQSELMPAQIRGFAVASYQMSFSIGGIVMSIVCHFTAPLTTDWAWRIPFCLYYTVPLVVASLVWFIPESPRFLLSKGQDDEARRALRRLRVNNDEESIEAEVRVIKLGLEASHVKGEWKELVQGNNKRRTVVVVGVNFFLQWTGQAFSSQFGVIFVKSLNTIAPFNYTLISSCIGGLAVIISMVLVDKIGRRPMMMSSALCQAMFLMIMGGLGTIQHPSAGIKGGIVACALLFAVSFAMGWAPLNYIIVTEIAPQRLRDKYQRLGAWTNILCNFVVSFTLPYLLNEPSNLGSRVGFIYGSFAILAFIFAYFCIPECKSRSFEEISLLFEHGIAARKSASWKPDSVEAELEQIVEDDAKIAEVQYDEKRGEEMRVEKV